MSYISFENVKKEYQMGEITIKAVDGVDFTVDKGEFAIIVGPSGAGKTTVLNMLGGDGRLLRRRHHRGRRPGQRLRPQAAHRLPPP